MYFFLCCFRVLYSCCCLFFFFFKQKTAYEMRISDWSSDVCSSDLRTAAAGGEHQPDNNRNMIVSELNVAEATDRIYESLQADNADLDMHIAALKAALTRAGVKEAVFDPARLVQNNRSGRKLMQAYFRQRGVTVKFSA